MSTYDVENSNHADLRRRSITCFSAADFFLKNRKIAKEEQQVQVTFCTLIRHSKRQQRQAENVAMAWIDNENANDMIMQSWIVGFLKMYNISDKVINLISETMKNWKVKLTVGELAFAEVKIQRGFFQGNMLSPLLFVITMILFNCILKKCRELQIYKITRKG